MKAETRIKTIKTYLNALRFEADPHCGLCMQHEIDDMINSLGTIQKNINDQGHICRED